MTNPPDSMAPTAPAPEKASLFEDFIDIFYAPGKVFARRENASVWPYFLIVWVVAAILAFASRALFDAIFDVEFSRGMQRMMEQNPQMTPEMAEQGRGIARTIGTVGQYIAMPLFIFFGGVFLWIGAKVVKAQVDFGKAMLIAAIAQIPRLLGMLITTVQGLMMDPTTISGANEVSFGPGRFMDPESTSQAMLQVLMRLDLFTLWVTVLFGIGVAVIGKVSRGKGFAAAAIAWLLGSIMPLIGLLRS